MSDFQHRESEVPSWHDHLMLHDCAMAIERDGDRVVMCHRHPASAACFERSSGLLRSPERSDCLLDNVTLGSAD